MNDRPDGLLLKNLLLLNCGTSNQAIITLGCNAFLSIKIKITTFYLNTSSSVNMCETGGVSMKEKNTFSVGYLFMLNPTISLKNKI